MNAIPPPVLPVASPGLCTEQEVTRLVHDFYARVRGRAIGAGVRGACPRLAGASGAAGRLLVGDAARHPPLQGLADVQAHGHRAGQGLFDRWLVLFRITTAECGNPPMQELANDVAARIGDTFWKRYQMLRWPQVGLPVLGIPAKD
jgi:hemoglobin